MNLKEATATRKKSMEGAEKYRKLSDGVLGQLRQIDSDPEYLFKVELRSKNSLIWRMAEGLDPMLARQLLVKAHEFYEGKFTENVLAAVEASEVICS